MLKNPFAAMKKREWLLWGVSLAVVLASNLLSGILKGSVDPVNLIGTCVGVTALIFVARGDVWGQILTVVFAVLYGIAAWRVRYWGEILTYLGMSAPIAALAVVSWLKNPYNGNRNEVKIQRLTGRQKIFMFLSAAAVTAVSGWILGALHTPNLFFSTVSVTTSYLASWLTLQRSSWYGFAYACNDVVLIVLWVLASMEDVACLPMIACFVMFFLNDMYGFSSWKKREKKQRAK
ncbi:MAG: nicotinamide mononucleotide transporter [Clostridia bacterium]|nr:nicotinamide mononucleotide transporter [Clostridia bacterium]